MKVSEFMTTNVVSCHLNDTVRDAAKMMVERKFSVLPIVDDNQHLVGIITESDFVGKDAEIPHALASIKRILGQLHYFGDMEQIYHNAQGKKLSEVMSPNPLTVSPEDTLSNVVRLMGTKNIKRVPVVENKKLVGIVTRKDLIKAFIAIN
jgi:CBS domain-containing protein